MANQEIKMAVISVFNGIGKGQQKNENKKDYRRKY
jgi:hypothetical protein